MIKKLYYIIDNKSFRGEELQYASKYLLNDRDVIIKSVRNLGFTIRYASPRLQKNMEIRTIAFKDPDIKNKIPQSLYNGP